MKKLKYMNTTDILKKLIEFPTVSRDSNLELIHFISELIATKSVKPKIISNQEGTKANLFAVTGPKINNGVMLSGDVMYDVYLKFSPKKYRLDDDLKKSKYILTTIHRRENINSAEKLSTIFNNLNEMNEERKIIMPLHPHTKQKIEEYGIQSGGSQTVPVE